jgi:hypothetical protein
MGVVTGMAPVDAGHGGFRGNVLPPEPPPQKRRNYQQNAKQPEELIGQNEGYIGAKRQGDDAHLGEPPGHRAQKGAEQIGGDDANHPPQPLTRSLNSVYRSSVLLFLIAIAIAFLSR